MNFNNMSDEALALFMQQHDGEGIEALIERFQEPLFRYASRLIHDPEKAEDTIQNTFVAAYQNINSYNPDRPFSPWIYRIAHNKSINEIRSHRFHVDLTEVANLPAPEDSKTMAKTLDAKDLRKNLDKYLDNLPLKYKEPLILRYFEDKSYEEISDILKIPKNTVGVRIKRGLERLKININPKDKEYL